MADPRKDANRRTTLLALDGNSLAHRAYHAYGASNMRNDDGQPTWAVYGFLALLGGICEKVRPDALIVGFDGSDNARKKRYPDYKATRSEKAPELVSQLEAIPALLQAMGVAVATPKGWEADDVVASWSHQAEQAGWQTIVATSDRDAFSLITDRCAVMRLRNGLDNAVFYTPARLKDEYGVHPQQYTDFSALRGDSSDNLPGVDGIGEKTAAKLLDAFDTVERALHDPAGVKDAIGPAGLRRLEAGQANWRRNVEMMAQRRDLPVELDRARLDRIDESTFAAALREVGLSRLTQRLASSVLRVAPAARTTSPPKGEVVTADTGAVADPPAPPSPAAAPPAPPSPADVAPVPSGASNRPAVPAAEGSELVELGTDPRLEPATVRHRRPTVWPATV